MRKTRLEGDHQALTFGLILLFDRTHPGGPTGPSKSSKMGAFSGSLNKKWEFGGHA